MNHSWDKDNVCRHCGIVRKKRDYRKLLRTYSKLINGVWEDVPVYISGEA